MNSTDTAALFVMLVGLAAQLGVAVPFKEHDEIGSAELKVTELLTFVKCFAQLSRHDHRGYHSHPNGKACHGADR